MTEGDFDPWVFLTTPGEGRVQVHYAANQVITSQGESSDILLCIVQGTAKKEVVSKSGRSAVLGILGKGEFIGFNVLVGERIRRYSIVAITDCSIMRLDAAFLGRALLQMTALHEYFLRFLISRYLRVQDDLVNQRFSSSEQRLARALVLLADFGRNDSGAVTIPALSQETLADMIGTTRSRVSVFMNKFRRQGFIDYDGNSVRLDRSLLKLLED